MKRLIITADDYGMSESVNKAIKEGIIAGNILSTNIMTNMDYCENGHELRMFGREISIGIHWNLTAGRPVSPVEQVKSLVDQTGRFYSLKIFRNRYLTGRIKKQHILNELTAQYNKFVEICGEPDYWNTHQNIHVNFGLFKLFVNLASELKIMKMRSHNRINVVSNGRKKDSSIIRNLKGRIIASWIKYAERKGFNMPDGVLVFGNYLNRYDIKESFRNIKWLDSDMTAELYVHPATEMDSEYFGKIKEGRIKEYIMCKDDDLNLSLRKFDIEIVNFDLD